MLYSNWALFHLPNLVNYYLVSWFLVLFVQKYSLPPTFLPSFSPLLIIFNEIPLSRKHSWYYLLVLPFNFCVLTDVYSEYMTLILLLFIILLFILCTICLSHFCPDRSAVTPIYISLSFFKFYYKSKYNSNSYILRVPLQDFRCFYLSSALTNLWSVFFMRFFCLCGSFTSCTFLFS